MVCAAHARQQVLGMDFDRQGTLTTWAARRAELARQAPDCLPLPVRQAELSDWRSSIAAAAQAEADLVVIDTPPSVELNPAAILGISAASTLVLVPCGQTQDDIDSVAPWMAGLREAGVPAAFVLNRASRRSRSFGAARTKLLAHGPVCPVEVPLLEEIHLTAAKGLGVMDLSRAACAETFEGLWRYVAWEMGR